MINRNLHLKEIIDLALPHLKGKERVTIPTFTQLVHKDWFIRVDRIAPRSKRQI